MCMTPFHVTIINEHFSQSAELKASDQVGAWKEAVASAIAIASDQVSHGSPFFGALVILAEGEKEIGRYVVSVGASPLSE